MNSSLNSYSERMVVGIQQMIKILYCPVLFFFLVPLFCIATGLIFALQYNHFDALSFGLLYLFILLNQMLENVLLRIPTSDFEVSKRFIVSLEVLNAALLLYFGWQHSWIAALVLLLYSVIIQVQFFFSYYHLDELAAFMAAFLKVFLLNAFAFYTHTHFIHPRYLPVYLGLFLPFFLFEVTRTEWQPKRKWLTTVSILSFLIGILLLWSALRWQSLFLLLALPFAFLFRFEFSRKTTAIFAFAFSLVFNLLVFISI